MADSEAEGGHCFSGNPPTVSDVSNKYASDPGITNVVRTVDVTSIANDEAGDGDYDDPYPSGGQSKPPIIPYT